jgi:serine protease Do
MRVKFYTTLILSIFSISITFGQTLTELYRKVSPSVVQIIVKTETTKGTGDPYDRIVSGGMGTGVLMNKEGDIITAAHVISNASEIEIVYKNGETSSASIEAISNVGDVALLRANIIPKDAVFAKFGDSDKVEIGSDIFVIGFPMGLNYSLSRGVISGFHKQELKIGKGRRMEFFQTDASINTGNSGGPMFNFKGEVIGIVSSILTQSGGFEGIGFAATSNLAKQLLYKGDKFWFGVDGTLLSGTLAEILNIPQEGGLLVTNVTPNSPAYFLGLRGGYLRAKIADQEVFVGGDIILSIEGIPLSNVENISEAWSIISEKKEFETITFKVIRGGSIKEYKWKVK